MTDHAAHWDDIAADISEAGVEWCRACHEWHLPEGHDS